MLWRNVKYSEINNTFMLDRIRIRSNFNKRVFVNLYPLAKCLYLGSLSRSYVNNLKSG
jgi:hypothetical protein